MNQYGLVASAAAILLASTAAMAADLTAPVAPATVTDPSSVWNGPYFGGLVGYASAPFKDEVYDYYGANPTGFFGGAELGYNFLLPHNVLVGVEGDIAWGSIKDTSQWDSTYSLKWSGSVRGRAGVVIGAFLPYLTGGWAIAKAQNDYGDVWSRTPQGWTAGAGIEAAINQHVSAKIEYRHSDFGSDDYGYRMHLTEDEGIAGVNYHF